MAITRIKADTALSGTIPATNISSASLANVSTGTSWQAVKTTSFTAVAGEGYFVNTTSGAITVTLPGTATVGDTIVLKDYNGTWATNNVTISSTLKISGADADGTLSTNNTTTTIVYMDTTKGWTPIQNSTQGALALDPTYISATGGTVTESGDYKIHTFTGDGCFVVSSLGSGIPCAQASTVDYLVVAGGGAARDGGAGAGGFRESKDSGISSPHTASPLANTTGLTITATTYPVSIGAGGADSPTDSARNGTPSSFSTITSAGGGYGRTSPPGSSGGPGGSGGAGRGGSGGTGNTPPVSPPQGNNGGTSSGPDSGAGGGGGATTVGGNWPGPRVGGTGATTSISGSAVGYSGGGAGAAPEAGTNIPREPSGSGGEGISGGQPAPGTQCGVANTGGGGGGVWNGTNGAGGSGIVIIRYKFQ